MTADDARLLRCAILPFILSTQILLWFPLQKLLPEHVCAVPVDQRETQGPPVMRIAFRQWCSAVSDEIGMKGGTSSCVPACFMIFLKLARNSPLPAALSVIYFIPMHMYIKRRLLKCRQISTGKKSVVWRPSSCGTPPPVLQLSPRLMKTVWWSSTGTLQRRPREMEGVLRRRGEESGHPADHDWSPTKMTWTCRHGPLTPAITPQTTLRCGYRVRRIVLLSE